MPKEKPLIGITSGYNYEKNILYLNDGYYEGINEAGGIAIAIPPCTNESILNEFVERCDGILLSGGPDLDAKHFGESNKVCNGEISPVRDACEIHITRKAIELKKPILGICRGIQVINVAMGGTLYQDIISQIKDREVLQHSQKAPKSYSTHEILIEKNSKICYIFNKDSLYVNSFHHQAVKDLAPDFIISAKSKDGIIEAIECSNDSFVVGVQWHPELMWRDDKRFLRLFDEFVNCSRLKY